MFGFRNLAILAAAVVSLLACTRSAPPADTSADEAAIRAINPAWFKLYAAGDADGVVALYAEDAVFNAPGAPPVRGRAAMQDFFKKDIAATQAAGVSFKPSAAKTEVGVSGDLGWEWGTFTAVDKSGATVDAGKYVSVFRRKDGKWQIIRDIYNSDMPPAASAAAPAGPATAAPTTAAPPK